MMRTNDPVRDAERYAAEADDYINNCPVCDICGEPITDEYYYEVGGRWAWLSWQDKACLMLR